MGQGGRLIHDTLVEGEGAVIDLVQEFLGPSFSPLSPDPGLDCLEPFHPFIEKIPVKDSDEAVYVRADGADGAFLQWVMAVRASWTDFHCISFWKVFNHHCRYGDCASI